MAAPIQWIPFGELILEPERMAAPRLSALAGPGPAGAGLPLVMVTPDRHVIAGRAYLRAGRIGGEDLIPCRVVHPDDLEITLTALHNQILYRQLDSDDLGRHLELYAELCRHLQLRAGSEERLDP